jgi:hypothetical protein
MMRCINCSNEVNVGAIVCPYCHYSPIWIDLGPYDGGPNARPHPSNQPADAIDVAMTFGLLGAVSVFVIPPVGIGLLGVAGVALLKGIFGKK